MISTDRGKWTIATTLFLLVITGTGAGIVKATEPSPDLYAALERFHGHTCGGSIMGVRLGLAARAAQERAGMPGKLKAQYFSLSCPVDGIQVAAGTTYGNRAIDVQDQDEHRLILIDEKSGRKAEARLTETAMQKAKASREIAQKARALPAGSPEGKQLEQEVEGIFAWLRTAPEADVVIVKFVR
jgi:formylmethanofuran dehydrogenase subunit E